MRLKRALSAEFLKIKRTAAVKMVVVAPLAVVCLAVFMALSAPFSTLHQTSASDDWKAFARLNFQFWGLLMMPLYITLQSALVAGLDHSENQWKAILARPIPRWTVYTAKLLLVTLLTVAAGAVLVILILFGGATLRAFSMATRFAFPMPVSALLIQSAQMTGLALLALSVQLWVSLRWRAFSVATGFGVVATITTFAMLLAAGPYGDWPQYYPWALPMLVLARQPHDIVAVLWCVTALTAAMSVLGCIDFCRREVQ